MAIQTLQPGCAPANPIVTAYLAARAHDREIDQSDGPNETVEARMAQYAEAGGRYYAMAWGINTNDHGALVALLTANRLDSLIDGYSHQNDCKQKVLTFGVEELNEVLQIRAALVNLWKYLDPHPNRQLKPLAIELDLIDEHGNSLDREVR